ncbi:GDSL family lipase [Pontibacter sp. 172403-2]|uniref:SGNH/GDSL hydrolase family protein n=1 Tax=Pontibacter rufus TaxID=2791028 RepID=UPI0018AFD52A|nr:SGNH/GDSL hydrolase family protein [Pontibacter sp. 172403-2]MBF9252548.1 GDSL family lipase [Pontibacter sp. 172403-2]
MKFSNTYFAAALCLFYLSCNSSKLTSQAAAELPAAALEPYGRYTLNDAQNLELVSSAAHVGFSFAGTEARVFAAAPDAGAHTYLQYELDGEYQGRLKISGLQDTLVITAPTAGKHTVWLYKTTEAHTGPLVIKKVSGQQVAPLAKPDAPLIEFIGNSITCGAAADPSEVPCGTGEYHDQHNAYMAYGPRVARALNANFILSCVSGIGTYRNWNSDGPTMPEVYEKEDFRINTPQDWDFSRYTPAVVSIALGTNDFSEGDGTSERLPFDSAQFVNSYSNFVKLVKTKYPEARIALLSSPMLNGRKKQMLENCLTAIKAQIDAAYPSDKPVALHFFEPMQASGCSGHPSVEEHGIMANELAPFFQQLLKPQG